MRTLTKVEKPDILRRKEEEWTAAYVAAANSGADLKPYEKWRHRQIKEALRDELRGKCAYCEGFVEDVAYPHVEHIIPKAIRPDLAHRWHNLTSACPRCNVAKDDYYDIETTLLNPYEDELDTHLKFLGNLISWELGSTRGELTIKQLDLNRLDLANERAKRLAGIRQVLERWHGASGATKEMLAEGLRMDARDGEFTAAVVSYLQFFDFPL